MSYEVVPALVSYLDEWLELCGLDSKVFGNTVYYYGNGTHDFKVSLVLNESEVELEFSRLRFGHGTVGRFTAWVDLNDPELLENLRSIVYRYMRDNT